jgi:hypothetical protein
MYYLPFFLYVSSQVRYLFMCIYFVLFLFLSLHKFVYYFILCHLYMSLHKFDYYFHYFMCVYLYCLNLYLLLLYHWMLIYLCYLFLCYLLCSLSLCTYLFLPIMLCLYSPLFVNPFISQLLTALANYFYAFFKFYLHKILLGTDVVKVIFKGISIICQTFTNAT